MTAKSEAGPENLWDLWKLGEEATNECFLEREMSVGGGCSSYPGQGGKPGLGLLGTYYLAGETRPGHRAHDQARSMEGTICLSCN